MAVGRAFRILGRWIEKAVRESFNRAHNAGPDGKPMDEESPTMQRILLEFQVAEALMTTADVLEDAPPKVIVADAAGVRVEKAER
jgi:hypothetical protein